MVGFGELCFHVGQPARPSRDELSLFHAFADKDFRKQGSHLQAAAFSQQWDRFIAAVHTLGGQALALLLLLLQRTCSPLRLPRWPGAFLRQCGALGNFRNTYALHSVPELLWPLPPSCSPETASGAMTHYRCAEEHKLSKLESSWQPHALPLETLRLHC